MGPALGLDPGSPDDSLRRLGFFFGQRRHVDARRCEHGALKEAQGIGSVGQYLTNAPFLFQGERLGHAQRGKLWSVKLAYAADPAPQSPEPFSPEVPILFLTVFQPRI